MVSLRRDSIHLLTFLGQEKGPLFNGKRALNLGGE